MNDARPVFRKRELLGYGLAATGLAASGPIRAARTSGFSWRRFEGQRLEVFLSKSGRADVLQKYQPEFEALTGIKVGSEQAPEQQHRQKFMMEFMSGKPSFDVVTVAVHVQKKLLGKTKWLQDLRGYLQDPELTAPDFDFADFSPASIAYSTQLDGRLDMLMHNTDYNTLYWNKTLFAEKGVPYPRSLDEMVEAAKALHDPKRGVAGFVSRGLKNANTPTWGALLLGWDQSSIDPDLTVHTTSAEAVAAATMYQTLMRDYGPPGVAGFNWNEAQTTFGQGRAAMWLDASGFAGPLEDSTKSRVAGHVGYGVVPPGPKGHFVGLSGDALGIPAASARKGPAWLYLQWGCGKLMQLRELSGGYGAPPRNSAYAAIRDDPARTAPLAWLDCMTQSAPLARPHHPQIVAVTEFRDIFGIALTNMIGGADPAAELEHATKVFSPILQNTEQ